MVAIFNWLKQLGLAPEHLSPEEIETHTAFFLRKLGIGMVMIFEPVFIYKLVGGELAWVVIYYLMRDVGEFIFSPLAAKIAARFGFERTMALSLPVHVLYFALLNCMEGAGELLFFILPIWASFGFALYWIPFRTNLAHYGSSEERGKSWSLVQVISDGTSVAAPIIGGILLALFSFKALFLIGGAVMLVSCLPMIKTREQFKPSHLSYWKAFRRLILSYKTYKHSFFMTYFGRGVDEAEYVFWPIFISIILVDNFSLMGLLSGGATLLIALYAVYLGMAYDRFSFWRNQASFYTSLIIYSVIWPLRIWVGNWWQVITATTLGRLAERNVSVGVMAVMLRRAGLYGNLKYTVFFAQSLLLGRICLLGILLILDVWIGLSFPVIFGLAAVWSLLSGAMWRQRARGMG